LRLKSLIESEVIWGAKASRMLGRFGPGAPTVRAWTVTIREEAVEGSRIVVKLEGQAGGHDEARGLASCGGGGYTVHDQVYSRWR
jgi:hypothetical protein